MQLFKSTIFIILSTVSLFAGFFLAMVIMNHSISENYAFHTVVAPAIAVMSMTLIKLFLFPKIKNRIMIFGFGINMIAIPIILSLRNLFIDNSGFFSMELCFAGMVTIPAFMMSIFAFAVLEEWDKKRRLASLRC